MSTAPAFEKCRGTRWCPKAPASSCSRCGLPLCGPHQRETQCLRGGAHKVEAMPCSSTTAPAKVTTKAPPAAPQRTKPKACRTCGAAFPPNRNQQRCVPCMATMSPRATKAPPAALRTCSDCNAPFSARGRARRCSECYSEAKHPLLRRTCEHCSKDYVTTSPASRRCKECRFIGRAWTPTKKKYDWTPERDATLRNVYGQPRAGRTNVKQQAAAALGFPAWACQKRASLLGLTRETTRQEWTPEEEQFLRAEMGRRTVDWLAKKLGRSTTSIVLKMKREGLSRREMKEWWSARDVGALFGIDAHAVTRWIQQGWIRAEQRGAKGKTSAWVVDDQALLEFVVRHPLEFDVRKVEQKTFMDLLLGPGGLRQRTTPGTTVPVAKVAVHS